MRTAIVGAGSMGLVLGAYLSKAKEQVDLIDVNKEHIDALKANGATIIGTVKMEVPVNAITYDEITGKYDLIFLMTKQIHNKSIVENLVQYMNDDAVICTMQNGMPEPSVAQVIGDDRVVGCTIAWGATYTGPGVSELTSEPDALTFDIGTMTGKARGILPISEVLVKRDSDSRSTRVECPQPAGSRPGWRPAWLRGQARTY